MHDLDAVVVVLHRPQEAANIGAVLRAMKNMGFAHLRLVQPSPFSREGVLRVAHRCEDLLDRMAIYSDLDEALADVIYVVGTAALMHADRPRTSDVRGLARDLRQRASQGRVALLFGQEDDGLDRYALDRCHLLASLAANPDYPALNLAQSVLLFLYELRMVGGDEMAPRPTVTPLARQAELERLFQISEEALATIGFFKGNPAAVMRTLRQIAQRAELRQEEVALLMAVARTVTKVVSALPFDVELELASFANLSDDTLWILARTSLSSKDQKQLSKLNNLAQKRELTAGEQERQQALIDDYDRMMIRRAQAAVILKTRGYDISDPKVLQAI